MPNLKLCFSVFIPLTMVFGLFNVPLSLATGNSLTRNEAMANTVQTTDTRQTKLIDSSKADKATREQIRNSDLKAEYAASNDDILLASFFRNNCDTSDYLYTSIDGVKFEAPNVPRTYSSADSDDRALECGNNPANFGNSPFRDPSIMYRNGLFWVISGGSEAYASGVEDDTSKISFHICWSADLLHWYGGGSSTESSDVYSKVDIRVTISNMPYLGPDSVFDAVAPEWFQDSDGELYILFTGGNYSEGPLGGKRVDLENYRNTRAYIAHVNTLVTDLTPGDSYFDMQVDQAVLLGGFNTIDNRDVAIFLNDSKYYALTKLGTPTALIEKNLAVYSSDKLTQGYSLYNTDLFKNPAQTRSFRLFEGPSVIKYRGKVFVYVDNYINAGGSIPGEGGKVNYSVGDSLANVTMPRPISLVNNCFNVNNDMFTARNARHGSVTVITDPNAKKIVWKFRLGQSTDNADIAASIASNPVNAAISYAFSKEVPLPPYGIDFGLRQWSGAQTCNFSQSFQVGGRNLEYCILPNTSANNGPPVDEYDIWLECVRFCQVGDDFGITVDKSAKRGFFSGFHLNNNYKEYHIHVRAHNANGYGTYYNSPIHFVVSNNQVVVPKFKDISKLAKTRRDAINWLAGNCIAVLGKKYYPNSAMNRGSISTMVAKLLGSIHSYKYFLPYTPVFTDTKGISSSRITQIRFILQNRYLTMTKNGTQVDNNGVFSPNNKFTRGQMAEMFFRLGGDSENYVPSSTAKQKFTDLNGLTYERQRAIYFMFDKGLTKGTTATTYSTNKTVTRGQMAEFLKNFYDKLLVNRGRM